MINLFKYILALVILPTAAFGSITNNVVSGNQTICNSSNAILTGTVPTFVGCLTDTFYQWQSSTDNNSWGSIPGATNQNYTVISLSQNNYFRRIAESTGCISDTSNVTSITIQTVSFGNTISSGQTVCSGSSPVMLSVTTPILNTGCALFTYQWQSSADNSNFSDCTTGIGFTSSSYTPPALSGNRYFKRITFSANSPSPCNASCTFTSDTTTVTVQLLTSGNVATAAQTICSGSTPGAFSVTSPILNTGCASYTYQWQSSTDNSTFSNCTTGTGITSSIYTPPSLISNRYFRRNTITANFPSPCTTSCTFTSNSVAITIQQVSSGNVASAGQTICSGSIPNSLSVSSPVLNSGCTSFTYQWQSSTDNTTFTDCTTGTGITSSIYTPPSLIANRYFRRNTITADTPSPCAISCTFTSNSVIITVQQVSSGNVTSSSQTICSGSTPSAQSVTSLILNTGCASFTYQWQSSTDNSTFSDCTTGIGFTSTSYTPPTLSGNRYFRRNTFTANSPSPCSASCTFTSNVSTVTIQILASGNVASSSQTICSGSTSGSLSVTSPILNTGCATFTYQWQSSTDNSSFTDCTTGTGINSSIYTPPSLIANRYFRRNTITGNTPSPCTTSCSYISNSIGITIQQVLSGNAAAAGQTICSGNTPSALSVSTLVINTGCASFTYQWQSSTDNSTFIDCTSGSGINSSIYTPPSITGNRYFRRNTITSNSPSPCTTSCTFTSNPVIITVQQISSGNVISSDQTICRGGTPATLSLTSPNFNTGCTSFTYQWQSSTDNLSFSDCTTGVGFTSSIYTPQPLTSDTYFRRSTFTANNPSPCTITCTYYSNATTILVNPPIGNNTIQSNQTICLGTSSMPTLTGSLPTGGNGIYAYEWQSSSDNSSFTPVGGSSDYTPPSLSANTYFRRIVISGPCLPNTSNTVEITVYQPISNTITGNQTICTGSAAAVLSDVNHSGGDNSYTYQWEVSANNSVFTAVSGGTIANYLPGVLTGTLFYRRIVSSAICNPNTSSTIVVTVNQNISNNTINAAQTICFGDTPLSLNGTSPAGGNGTYTYKWQQSLDNGLTFPSDATGGVNTNSIFAPPSLTSTVYYRRVVTSGPCLPVTSSPIGVLVLPVIFDNSVSANQTICTGTQPNILLGLDASGGNASYSYNWQSSSDNISFNSISGSNTLRDYASPVLTSNTYFRRSVISGPCASLSDTLAIMVEPIIGDNTIGSNQTICFGNSPSTLTGMIPSGGGGNYSYQWESSLNNNTWSNIPLANSGSYPGVNLQSTHYYRRIVSASYCSANTSSSVRINVYNVFVPGMITTTDSVICYNESPTQFVLSSNPSGGDSIYTYNWQSSSNGSAPWNNVGTGGNTFQSGNIQTNTYYRLQVTSGSNCGTQATNQIYVAVNPLPAPFQIIGNDTVCRNQQVTIFKLSNDSTYFARLWSVRNSLGTITFGFNQAVCYVNWGMISGWDTIVFIRTNNNTTCSRTVKLPVYVSNGVAPALTSILRKPNSNILACNDSTPGIQYQWGYCLKADVSNYANYTDIPGANLQYVFLPSAPGFDTFNYYYYVKTFYNDPQCQTISYYNYDPIVLGTANLKEDGFSLYPNPSAGEVFLKHNKSDVKQVQAFSLTGAEIAIEYDALAQKIKFDEAIPTGLYLLVIQLDEGFITGRVQIIR